MRMRIPARLRARILLWCLAQMRRILPVRIVRAGRGPYLDRYVVLRSWLTNVYIHHFRDADVGVDPHDHPWPFITFVLAGGYVEEIYDPASGRARGIAVRRLGDVVLHGARHTHRIAGLGTSPGECVAVTLVVTGPRVRRWRFYDRTARRWVPSERYISARGLGPRPVAATDG